jgi:hypothetical protein
MLGVFREAVYKLDGKENKIINALQRIFYQLEKHTEAVKTTQLLQAFGWSRHERNEQQDVSEFWLLLSDVLEK